MSATSSKASFVLARNNPFATWRTDSLAFRFPQGSWEDNFRRLAELNFRAAIAGPQGTGKSTLLRELAEVSARHDLQPIPVRGSESRAENQIVLGQALKQCRAGTLILLDNAERLTWWQWRRLLRRTKNICGLVVTVHRATRLPTWIQTAGRWETCCELLVELGFDQSDDRLFSAARELHDLHRGNVRQVFRSLYDQPPQS